MTFPESTRRFDKQAFAWLICFSVFALALATPASAQIRTKKPDRGTYQPPVISRTANRRIPKPVALADVRDLEIEAETDQSPLVDIVEPWDERESGNDADGYAERYAGGSMPAPVRVDSPLRRSNTNSRTQRASNIQPVTHAQPLTDPQQVHHQPEPHVVHADSEWENTQMVRPCSCESCSGGQVGGDVIWEGGPVGVPVMGDVIYDGGCDSIGCDSIGCGRPGCGCGSSPDWAPASLSFCRDRWFGSIELLMMARKGDRLPALVTSGPSNDSDTAGQRDQADTVTVVGDDVLLRDGQPGGRLTLGTWLNACQSRSMVFRGWASGDETYNFSADQTSFPVLARPFFNVSDGQTPEEDTQLIAFPGLTDGSINVHAESSVFGGDLSIRQLWHAGMGGSIDVLYGYQYMRLNESLAINTVARSVSDDVAPIGTVIAVDDSFDAENEFHGGQIGIASAYREGCWSFSTLAKAGFGSLRRRGVIAGSTTTSIDENTAFDPNGLLARSTNIGTYENSTFAWIPELDFTLGYHYFPNFDITVGYHIIAMTDALQVSGLIDPGLAVNLDPNPTGQLSPAANLTYDTFYVQGVHLGLSYVY